MNKNVMWMALVLACSSSVAMAQINLDFLYDSGTSGLNNRSQNDNGDSITLDFSVDGAGVVSLVAEHVDITGAPGDDSQLWYDTINSWNSANVGNTAAAALFNDTFQLTVYATLNDAPENMSFDDSRGPGNTGSIGIGGQHSSRIDGQDGGADVREILHFAQTGGTAQINLLDFSWHGQSDAIDLWDTRLIAGAVDMNFPDLLGTDGTVDVSGFGYIIGSGANDLTFRVPDNDPANPSFDSHGLGVQGLTIEAVAVVPEPATFGLLAAFGTALLISRRRS